MRIVDGKTLGELLDDRAPIESPCAMFVAGCDVPAGLRHKVTTPNARAVAAATLSLIAAWESVTAAAVAGHAGDEPAADSGLAVPLAEALGVKCVTVYPGAEGLPAVMGDDMLLDGTTGLPQALIDGPAPAARRTAAASALATGDLARGDVRALTMVGGALAPHPVRAHATVRPTEAVSIWGWSKDEARASADALRGKLCGSFGGKQIIVQATDDLERVARSAGVISCATMSRDPLVRDDWIEPGRHRILASGFTPETRETDDASIACAQVYVDTRVGARMAA